MIRFRDVLNDKNFLLLWFGQVISNFGDRLNQMALVALVYQSNPHSEIALAKLISFTIIPVFIIGPVAGAWVDRLDRRNIMIISDILRGSLVLIIPLFIFLRQIIPIYLIIFLIFSISRFFIPSKMALIPDIVTKDKLLVANTLQNTTHMIGNVVGLVVAGIIVNIRYIGATGGFYIDAATFFISASLLAMIARRDFVTGVKKDLIQSKDALSSSIRRSIVSEIRDGLKYLTGHGTMRFVVYAFFLLMAGIGTISCVIIVFIQDAFGTPTRDLGLLGMFLVGGLFMGTVVYGKWGQKIDKKTVINASFVLTGIAVALFTIAVKRVPNIFLGGAVTWIVGMAVSPIMISTNTLTHELIPEDVRGRIFSSLEAVIHLAFLVFMFVAAYAAKYIGRSWILILTGVIFAVCGAAGIILEKRAAATYS